MGDPGGEEPGRLLMCAPRRSRPLIPTHRDHPFRSIATSVRAPSGAFSDLSVCARRQAARAEGRISISFLCSFGGLAIGCGHRHGRGRDGFLAGFDLAHRGAIEFEPVGIVNNTVQDRIAERGLADNFMPSGGRELAGDQDGATAIAILDDLHEIAPLAGGEAVRSPIIEHEKIDLDQHAEQPREAAVAMSEIEIGEQARHSGVVDGVAVAAGFLRQRTR